MPHGTAMAQIVSRPFAGRCILIVEDEYFLADDLAAEFERLGAHVIGPLSEIGEARELLSSGQAVDAALLDINVRNEMVFPLARLLRDRAIPFVFTTGYDKDSVRGEFSDVPLWEKPIDIPSLADYLAGPIAQD